MLNSKPDKIYIILIALLLLGSGLRFYRLGTQELRGDEAFSWNYVVHEPDPAAIVERIIREGDPQPPIHYWVLQMWVQIFGDTEWAMRSLSALLSIPLVPLVFQLGRRAFNTQVGLLVAALTTFHPYQIWLSQDVRNMYQLAIGAGLIATLLLPGLLRGRRANWIGYVLFGALAMYSHYYAIFGLVAHSVFVMLAKYEREHWMRWLAAGIAITVAVLPWAIIILPVYFGGQLADPTRMSFSDYFLQTLADVATGPTLPDAAGLASGIAWLVLAGIGLRSNVHIGQKWRGLFLIWSLIALIGIYLVVLTRATFNTFYFLVAFPAVYILVAKGIFNLWSHPKLKSIAALIVLFSVIMSGWSLRNYYLVPEWSKSRGMRAVGEILIAYAQLGDAYVANFPDPAQVYYLRNIPLPYFLLPSASGISSHQLNREIQDLGNAHQRLWFVPINAAQWDPDAAAESSLNNKYLRSSEFQLNKMRLQQYSTEPEQAAGFVPFQTEFSDGIKLLGAHLAINGMETALHPGPGDLFRITLLWEAESTPGEDYTVFVHALNGTGALVAQHDSPPQGGSATTRSWTVNMRILDVHEFALPENFISNELQITAGMYDPQSGARLIRSDWETDSVLLFNLEN